MNWFRKHVPIVYQMETAECGAASLGMVLAYYGRYESLAQLRKDCRVTADGCTMFDLVEAAQKYGFEAKAFRMPAEELKSVQPPFIAFWNFCHYVVIEAVEKEQVVVCDPAAGRKTIPTCEFLEHYSGLIIKLTPTAAFRQGGTKKSVLRLILFLFGGAEKKLACLSALIILVHLVWLLIPMFIRVFVDNILPAAGSEEATGFFAVFFCILAVQTLGLFLMKNQMLRLDQTGSEKHNVLIIQKVLRLPLRYFEMRKHSDLVSRLLSIGSISEIVITQCIPVFFSFFAIAAYMIMLFFIDAFTGIVLLLLFLITAAFITHLLSVSRNCTLRARNYANILYYAVNIDKAAAEKAFHEHEKILREAARYRAIYRAVTMAVPAGTQILLLLLGLYRLEQGKITAGMLLSCQFIGMSVQILIAEAILQISIMQDQEINVRGLEDIWQEEDDPEAGKSISPSGADVSPCGLTGGTEAEKTLEDLPKKPSARNSRLQRPSFLYFGNSVMTAGKERVYLAALTVAVLLFGMFFPFLLRSYIESTSGGDSTRKGILFIFIVLFVILLLYFGSNRVRERLFSGIRGKLFRLLPGKDPDGSGCGSNPEKSNVPAYAAASVHAAESLVISLIPAAFFFSQSIAITVILAVAMNLGIIWVIAAVLLVILPLLLIRFANRQFEGEFQNKSRELEKRTEELIDGVASIRKEGTESRVLSAYTEFYKNYTDSRIRKENPNRWLNLFRFLLPGAGFLLLFLRIFKSAGYYTEGETVLYGTMLIYLTCTLDLFYVYAAEIAGKVNLFTNCNCSHK